MRSFVSVIVSVCPGPLIAALSVATLVTSDELSCDVTLSTFPVINPVPLTAPVVADSVTFFVWPVVLMGPTTFRSIALIVMAPLLVVMPDRLID